MKSHSLPSFGGVLPWLDQLIFGGDGEGRPRGDRDGTGAAAHGAGELNIGSIVWQTRHRLNGREVTNDFAGRDILLCG